MAQTQTLSQLERRMDRQDAHAQYHRVVVTFPEAHQDVIVPHPLKLRNPEEIEYQVVKADRPVQLYDGSRPWTEGMIRLRASEAGAQVILLLSIPRTPAGPRSTPQWVPPVDPNPGSGGGGAGELSREVIPHTTGATGQLTVVTGSIDLGWQSAQLLHISADRQGYLVLFSSEVVKDGDSRTLPPSVDPIAGTGILAEFAFPFAGDAIPVMPPVVLHNSDDPLDTKIYYRWLSQQSGVEATNLSLTIVGME